MSIDDGLRYLGMADNAIKTMGPLLTIVISWSCSYAAVQLIKFPLGRVVSDPWFSWLTRVCGMVICWAFAHELSKSLNNGLEIAVAVVQPFMYMLAVDLLKAFMPSVLAKFPFLGAAPP